MALHVQQPSPDEGTNQGVPSPADGHAPEQAAALRLTQRVSDALRSVPGGEQLDEYFGISGGVPKQSLEEAAKGEKLIQGLKAMSAGNGDLSSLLGQIGDYNAASGVDPDVLRSLMGPPKKADH